MLKKKADIKPVVKEGMRGGRGVVTTYPFLTQQESHDVGRLFAKIVLPAGASIGMHDHVHEYEVFYVLSGRGVINDGSQLHAVEAGDMYICDDGEKHDVENAGDAPLELIALIPFVK